MDALGGSFQGLAIGGGAPDAIFVHVGQDPNVRALGPDGFAGRRQFSKRFAFGGLHISTATKTKCNGSPGQRAQRGVASWPGKARGKSEGVRELVFVGES